jgi:hypothetical protein
VRIIVPNPPGGGTDIIARLMGQCAAGRADRRRVRLQGLYSVGTCGADFGAFLRKQYDEFGRAIREANIKAE